MPKAAIFCCHNFNLAALKTFYGNKNMVPLFLWNQRVDNPRILKGYFYSRTHLSIFTSIATMLLDQSNEKSWVFPALKSTSHILPQSTVPYRSDSSSTATCTFCQRSDAWCLINIKLFYVPVNNKPSTDQRYCKRIEYTMEWLAEQIKVTWS